jgi:hypothetical protein
MKLLYEDEIPLISSLGKDAINEIDDFIDRSMIKKYGSKEKVLEIYPDYKFKK